MNHHQIVSVFDRYRALFKDKFYDAEFFPTDGQDPSKIQAMQHCYALCERLHAMLTEGGPELESLHIESLRVLSFIQGVFWTMYGKTLEEIETENALP